MLWLSDSPESRKVAAAVTSAVCRFWTLNVFSFGSFGTDESRRRKCSDYAGKHKPLMMLTHLSRDERHYLKSCRMQKYVQRSTAMPSPSACFLYTWADSRRCQERHSGTDCQANYRTANVGLASICVLGLRCLSSLAPFRFTGTRPACSS